MNPHCSSVQSLVTLQGPSDKLVQGEQHMMHYDLDQQINTESLASLGIKGDTFQPAEQEGLQIQNSVANVSGL